jgi:starch phosphorylase
VIRDIMSELKLMNYEENGAHEKKEVFYLSMEFLPGTSLRNNVFNLGLEHSLSEALSDMGKDLKVLYELEPDAGLGNGGLGRLASCYLDAIASLGMAGHGMSICYEYGIFKQKIKEGKQVELPDNWLDLGGVWLQNREDETKEVHFGGKLSEIWNENGEMKLVHKDYTTVLAVPHDLLISGYDSKVINTLRLWESASPISIDMDLFSQGKYLQAMKQKHMAEVISKILYPEDAHKEGKSLRIMQQYFFISASIQTIVKKHMTRFGTLNNFHEKVAIHINDTHPAMAIPELQRILVDEHGYRWEDAWEIVTNSISYTNHTIMPEALERWPEDLFCEILPRIHSIVQEINRRENARILEAFPFEEGLRRRMGIIQNGNMHMANLCVIASHTVNGVSELHSRIISRDLFNGFYRMHPEKFTNVTNGIAYRRWLCQANPDLCGLIGELCGGGFRKNASELESLMEYQSDIGVLEELERIKHKNKVRLKDYIYRHNNIIVNPDAIFDVQVKRFHEYKRQLLNLFHIMYLYNCIKENPGLEMQDRVFIFAGKAAAGYFMAKQIIRLAYHLSAHINSDPDVKGRLKIVFLENYSVTLSELIMPAAEISEQISLAGKEASGTGNMKLMINGALTLGTLDGANIEIRNAVGDENIFIFGMTVEDVERLRMSGTYSPWSLIQANPSMGKVISLMSQKINDESFVEIMNYLTTGYNGIADPYFILADFESYRHAHERIVDIYQNKGKWNRMALINIAKAGTFAADRSVKEYASRIWGIASI